MDPLENYLGWQKSNRFFDRVAEDISTLRGNFVLGRLLSQQLGSADSIVANIEEGYGRSTRKEYIRFLVIARGSAKETKGRYWRLRHWLPKNRVEEARSEADQIIRILTATISTLTRSS